MGFHGWLVVRAPTPPRPIGLKPIFNVGDPGCSEKSPHEGSTSCGGAQRVDILATLLPFVERLAGKVDRLATFPEKIVITPVRGRECLGLQKFNFSANWITRGVFA